MGNIRQQVDDFLVKPADPKVLVSAIEQKISRRSNRDSSPVAMPEFLRANGSEIIRRTLAAMKAHQQLAALPLSDGDRIDHLPGVFTRMATLLDSADRSEDITEGMLIEAAQHGKVRKRQGYSADMLVEDRRLLNSAIHNVVQENLLALNLSHVIPDLRRISDSLDMQLKAALGAYSDKREVAT